jgi:hypothetical protein
MLVTVNGGGWVVGGLRTVVVEAGGACVVDVGSGGWVVGGPGWVVVGVEPGPAAEALALAINTPAGTAARVRITAGTSWRRVGRRRRDVDVSFTPVLDR